MYFCRRLCPTSFVMLGQVMKAKNSEMVHLHLHRNRVSNGDFIHVKNCVMGVFWLMFHLCIQQIDLEISLHHQLLHVHIWGRSIQQ